MVYNNQRKHAQISRTEAHYYLWVSKISIYTFHIHMKFEIWSDDPDHLNCGFFFFFSQVGSSSWFRWLCSQINYLDGLSRRGSISNLVSIWFFPIEPLAQKTNPVWLQQVVYKVRLLQKQKKNQSDKFD